MEVALCACTGERNPGGNFTRLALFNAGALTAQRTGAVGSLGVNISLRRIRSPEDCRPWSASRLASNFRVRDAADYRAVRLRPVLPDEPDLLERKHFISVGSFRPTMQELPDSVYRLAGQLAVDSEHALHEVGDVINPVRAGLLREADVFSIGECVVGKRTLDVSRITACKSIGAAMYDLFVTEAFLSCRKSPRCRRRSHPVNRACASSTPSFLK